MTPTESQRKIVVTSALPYANGPIHIGHLVEYVQTDIWARYQRLCGHRCYYFCADDAHGTAVMLKARQLNMRPEVYIERINREHLRDFVDFNIRFDHWHSTHSTENKELSEFVWSKLKAKDLIIRKTISQFYDPVEKQFLSDRMVRGVCPNCRAESQYGDACEKCGANYQADELIEPRSIFGSSPILKDTEHYFFDLAKVEPVIQEWLTHTKLQPAVVNKVEEWLVSGLKSWDITRDAPYFGFTIPGRDDKYFYVWVDAPIGYIATSLAWSKKRQRDYEEFWSPDSSYELHHFIGKDIAYFHLLFWPALLHAADWRLPTRVVCHGFLTVNGQKMSKSRGTLVEARQWLKHYDPEYLRYYLAAKLNGEIEDIDFNLEDFHRRINADLVGKLFNIASRCSSLLHKYFDGRLAASEYDLRWQRDFLSGIEELRSSYESCNTNRLIRVLIEKADQINVLIQTHKPWLQVKQENKDVLSGAHGVLSDALNAYRSIMIWLSPVIPDHCQRALAQFDEKLEDIAWEDAGVFLHNRSLKPFVHLARRLEEDKMTAFLQDMSANSNHGSSADPVDSPTTATDARPIASAPDSKVETNPEGVIELIGIDDFAKIELRVARILSADTIAGADRLIRLRLDTGFKPKTVLAGIREWYTVEQLNGRLVVMVYNLKPRKTRFGVSEGMILAAAANRGRPYLVSVDEGAEPGMLIH